MWWHISQNEALNVTFKPASQPVHTFKVPFVSEILDLFVVLHYPLRVKTYSCYLCTCAFAARTASEACRAPVPIIRAVSVWRGRICSGDQRTQAHRRTCALPAGECGELQARWDGTVFPQYFNQYIHSCLCDMNSLTLFICLQGGFWLFGYRKPVCYPLQTLSQC